MTLSSLSWKGREAAISIIFYLLLTLTLNGEKNKMGQICEDIIISLRAIIYCGSEHSLGFLLFLGKIFSALSYLWVQD